MDCILCGAPSEFLFSTRDFENPNKQREYSVHWCGKCDFGRVAGDFSPSEIAGFYPQNYYTHSLPDSAKATWTFRQKLLFHIAWRLDQSRPVEEDRFPIRGSVCDIGCGNGDQLRLFQNSRRVGVDPDSSARLAAADAGTVFEGTAEDLPEAVSNDRFDVVLLSHVLEHCNSPQTAIRSAKRILADRGTLMIEVPNNESVDFNEMRELWPWSDVPRHLSFFTERSLRTLIESEGLRVKSAEFCGFTRQFSPSWIERQSMIWDRIGTGRKPNFELAAWSNLARSIIGRPSRHHDSIRLFVER